VADAVRAPGAAAVVPYPHLAVVSG
jgi:hypothetical protein